MERTSRPDLNGAARRGSSYSNQAGGNCVEVADSFPGVVPVRDSKVPYGPTLIVDSEAWAVFIARVKVGSYRF
ncbi:DUF397 domain-containing protein [Streptomyces sp. NPDC087844]|uniref:DUF397 domain-containing protein n=1 Tax=Streptomyces sp. NPDC087844 TaxID=3365805 RepID=UPI00382ACA9E